jgi:hypothetical protein
MASTAVRGAAEYEERLQQYAYERAEEARRVRVGEKEVSEQAAIIARYRDLFTRDQLEALREEQSSSSNDERERLYRLCKTCESGVISAELAEQEDAFENAILQARVTFRGDEMPLRSAQARLAVLDSYADREELGELERTASAAFNPQRRDLLEAREQLDADVSGEADPIARTDEEKAISLRELERVLVAASDATTEAYGRLRDRWFDRLLGPDRDAQPTNAHVHYLRRVSPLESTYTKEQAVEICLATTLALGFDMTAIPNIHLDLEDRPQKNPRACVIASNPPEVVHLITRAQGGLSDYQAFLHEAGHALHYAGVDPRLPYTFRSISRDHALTEIYSYIFEAVTREPAWHAQYFGLGDAVPRGAPLPPVHREAAVRARLLVGVRRRARDVLTRLRAAALCRDGTGLRRTQLPLRHGRRLLLGGLSARVGPRRAAARVSRARGGRRLVALDPDG